MIPIVKGWSTEIAQEVDVARRAGARRHGLHRGDRRGAALARRAHHHDLRGHDRHPGQRPHRPQDGARRRRGRAPGRGRDRQGRGEARRAHANRRCRRSACSSRPRPRTLQAAIDWMVPAYGREPRAAHAGAVAYLELWGLVAGGWQLGRAALIGAEHLAAGKGDAAFLHAKIATARYYADACCRRCRRLRTRSSMAAKARSRSPRRPSERTQDAACPGRRRCHGGGRRRARRSRSRARGAPMRWRIATACCGSRRTPRSTGTGRMVQVSEQDVLARIAAGDDALDERAARRTARCRLPTRRRAPRRPRTDSCGWHRAAANSAGCRRSTRKRE